MRILIVDPRRKRQEEERASDGPLSFFFSPDLSANGSYDLLVLPSTFFLERSRKLPDDVPLFAYGSVQLIADALSAGCSDYLREPWSLEELEARALRFWRIRFRLGTEAYRYSLGCLQGGKSSVRLPEGQRKILELLLHRLGRTVPRSAFLRTLDAEKTRRSRLLDMNISRLRKNLAMASGDVEAGTFLSAVRNYGYLLSGKPCA